MKTIMISLALLTILVTSESVNGIAQTPVTDVGAGIQREALWTQEKGILSKIKLVQMF